MIHLVSLDFETRSPVDLTVTGVARYVEDPRTDIWCMAYCLTENPADVQLWTPAMGAFPEDLRAAIAAGAYLRAWNASFERAIWNAIMVPRYGAPPLPTDRFVCAMAMAAAAALPLSLDKAAMALRLPQQKDMEGHRLMKKMCKPRRIEADGTLVWWDAPELQARLGAYCCDDVRTELAAWAVLPPAMNARERRIWLMDQRINDRGLRLDLPLVRAAHALVRRVQPTMAAKLDAITGGITITQVAKLRDWLATQGVETESLDKASVTALLEGTTLTPEVRMVLEARQGGAKASTAKFGTMLEAVCADERVRGSMQYYGATTGRWAGRGMQPHNFPKPTRKISPAILADIQSGNLDYLEMLYGPVLPLLSDILRSCFIPSEGKRLAVADYSQIEARVVAWLAGQDDLITAFAQGTKIYEDFAGRVFDLDPATIGEDSAERQAGKAGVLGCGFGMGPQRAAEQYGIALGLARKIVKTYRETYTRIVDLWANMNASANAATLGRCEVIVPNTDGKLRFEGTAGYLLLHLPSGRPLWYHQPVVRTYMVQRTEMIEDPITGIETEVDVSFQATGVECSTLNGVTKQWVRQQFYGGLWTENAVQACARDIMADAMLRCEDAGIEVVLSVHDEIVAEVQPTLAPRDFVNLLTTVSAWAEGCPIDAKGWIEERYRK